MALQTGQTISIEETARLLGIGRDAVRTGIQDGHIPAVRAGKHIRILLPALESKLRGDIKPDESEIARQVHLMGLRSQLELLDADREVLARQIAEIENAGQDGFNGYVSSARTRRRGAA